jgi:hypothetical protein
MFDAIYCHQLPQPTPAEVELERHNLAEREVVGKLHDEAR